VSAFAGVIENNLYTGKLERKSSVLGIDCIYVINLKERPDRLKKFQSYGISFVRFPAINGWKRFNGHHRSGQYGCLLSHMSIYWDALRKGYQRIWVLEDDAEVVGKVKKLTNLMRELYQIDPYWDILFTGKDTVIGLKFPRNEIQQINQNFARVKNRHGTFSMVMTRKGFQKVYHHFLERDCYEKPLDIEIYNILDPHIYTTMENLVLHDKDQLYKNSNIGHPPK